MTVPVSCNRSEEEEGGLQRPRAVSESRRAGNASNRWEDVVLMFLAVICCVVVIERFDNYTEIAL